MMGNDNEILRLNREIHAALVQHAENGLPHEVCGYLAAAEGLVRRHFPLTNLDSARDHFSMKPEEQFAAVKEMRAQGLSLRAVYHSHPETPARPSVEDIRLAHDPGISYVIVSLAGPEPVVKSFRINRGVAREERLEVV